jgi:exopolysaccharide/PEP-CTERM locus tyrosine autokinase
MSRIESALEKAVRLHELDHKVPPPAAPSGKTAAGGRPLFVPKNPLIVTLTEPGSPAAEEYRKLKAMVIKLTRQDARKNVIMITSSNSGEGKSLTAVNLAISLAQEVSHSALLIDADLRRPSLAAYLDITAKTGLAECLRDGLDASSAVIGTGVPKLELLPAGKSVSNPVELLSSPKMKSLLIELKRHYPERYIIIDTPPVLPFAETQIISMLVDGVLLVVKEGGTTVKDMQDALDTLKGTKVLGVAFNDVDVRAQGMNNRYRHYYQYYADRQRRQV